MKTITRDNLNDIMSFDHVIHVHADGSVTDGPDNLWAPEVTVDDQDAINPLHVSSQEGITWDLLTDYTGQYGYRGPLMHSSEYIGGKLADGILSRPGYYVAVEVGSDEWAVARILLDE